MSSKNKYFVFISYAWGGPFERKEWLRRDVIRYLDVADSTVFWDRDSIPLGHPIDDSIRTALSRKPLVIFCICDQDYVQSAKTRGSGVHVELEMISVLGHQTDTQVIPVVVDDAVLASLPAPLAGRTFLNLAPLRESGLPLGPILRSAVCGASQREILGKISRHLREASVWEKAEAHFQQGIHEIIGDAQSHRVRTNTGQLITAPQWMYDDDSWNYRASAKQDGYEPGAGIWAWSLGQQGASIQTLGAAICSAYFPGKLTSNLPAIIKGGNTLAKHVLSAVDRQEPLVTGWREFVAAMLHVDGGLEAIERLLT